MPPKSSSRLKFPKRVPKLCHIGHQIVPKCTRPAPKCTRPALLLSSRNHAGTTPPLNVLLRRNHRQLECRAVGTMWNHAGTRPSFDRFAETKPSVCKLWEPHGTTLEPHRNQAVSKEALSEMHTYGCRPDINIYY